MRMPMQAIKAMSTHPYHLSQSETLLQEGSLKESERLFCEKLEYQNLNFFEREQISGLFDVLKHRVTGWILWIKNCSVLAKQKQQDRIERWIIEPLWLPKWDAIARNCAYWHRENMLFTKSCTTTMKSLKSFVCLEPKKLVWKKKIPNLYK